MHTNYVIPIKWSDVSTLGLLPRAGPVTFELAEWPNAESGQRLPHSDTLLATGHHP